LKIRTYSPMHEYKTVAIVNPEFLMTYIIELYDEGHPLIHERQR